MEGQKIPFSFPILIPMKSEPMILKVWVKSKFLLWQPRYYNWLKKMIRKFRFLKYSFFEKVLLLSVSRNSLQTPSLDDIILENSTLSNSIISVKDLIKWKKGFEIFLIDHYAGDIGNKYITGKYQKFLLSLRPTLY